MAAIVIVHSGLNRSLSGSGYNERRAACERAVAAIRELEPGVRALRDVGMATVRRARGLMDDVAFRRASHVVEEIARPARFAAALKDLDLAAAGGLMGESHASLRDLYEVSTAELDLLVTLATGEQGCYGARLTGAGFGGCIVALVERTAVASFSASVAAQYQAATGLLPRVIVSRPAAGARLEGTPSGPSTGSGAS
jgi:galactokinase